MTDVSRHLRRNMPEFRQNRATKEWVIIAPGRGKRPSDFAKERVKRPAPPSYRQDCPFCPGNEKMTPEPVYMIPNDGAWKMRVVPNKFAALQPDLGVTRTYEGNFLAAKGFGIAEVVIEAPEHNKNIPAMGIEEMARIINAYRQRHQEISKNERINLVTIFRNYGPLAGTSLEHPHSQIIATPIVPPHVRYPIEQSILHYDKYGTCVYCDTLDDELHQKERIIIESDNFVAFCPWAARTPFESRIYPKRHMASFVSINNDEIDELAWVLQRLISKISKCLDDPDYNYVIRSSPVGEENARYLHWYIVMIPKITTPAGFEIGSGIYINSVAPEDSARFLRETQIP
jgi:UDPglucose--hexose-1-phosphate uridylyltransferase